MTEKKERNSVVRLYVGSTFIGSVEVVSLSDCLGKFFLLNSHIYLKWRLSVEEADQCYFKSLSFISTKTETRCNGWYYNVCQLREFQCPARLDNLVAGLNGTVAIVKTGKDRLLLMTDNKITHRLGIQSLSSSCNGKSLHCIHISRESSQSKADELPDTKYSREGIPADLSHRKQSDPYVGGFLAYPPDSSLLSFDTVAKIFQSQYEEYDTLALETSCARIDHQYIDSKLIKGDNKKFEDSGKFLCSGKMQERESASDLERNHFKVGKTGRNDVGEEILPERKRHKSENHRESYEVNDVSGGDGRKRHKTTGDANGFANESERIQGLKLDVGINVSADKKHKSSHKHEHKTKRKDKYEKGSHKEKASSHRKASDGVIESTRDENLKPNKDVIKDINFRNETESSKVKEKDKTQKKPEKESILSKLESSMKSFRKSKKENTDKKKSDTSKKHKSSSKTSTCDKPVAGHNKHQNVEQVFSSMFFGLSKELGRIPKKNKAKSENRSSTSPKDSVSDERKKSKSKNEKIEKEPRSTVSKSEGKDLDSKQEDSEVKDSKHKADKDSKNKERKSSHGKDKHKKRCDEDVVLEMTYEREDDLEILDSVGKGFDRQEMVRDVMSANDELDKMLSRKIEMKEGIETIPGLGDLDELRAFVRIEEMKEKRIKRTVLVTDSDLKISLPADMERKTKVEQQLDLPTLVNFALFGDEVMHPMSAACLHQYECCLSLHSFVPSPWTKSVSKRYNDVKKKYLYTVEILNPEHSLIDDKPFRKVTICDVNNQPDNNRKCFDDFTNKLMSEVQTNKSKAWNCSDSSQGSSKGNVENLLVIPAPTKISVFSDDDGDDFYVTDVNTRPDIEKLKDVVRGQEEGALKDVKRDHDEKKLAAISRGPDTEKLDDDNRGIEKVKDKQSMIEESKVSDKGLNQGNIQNKNLLDKDANDIVEGIRKETECKKDGGFNVNDSFDTYSNKDESKKGNTGKDTDSRKAIDIYNTCVVSIEMAAPTSRSPTPCGNQTRKRRSSGIENFTSKDGSIVSNSELQDSRRGTSKDKSPDHKSKERRSVSRNRSSRSGSRDRCRRSNSKERRMQSSSKDRNKHSESRERSRRSRSRDSRPDTPTETGITSRLLKIALSKVGEPDKMSSKSNKRRERQYHPYKKETRPSKRHIPHWSFDLAYSDMNELLQNLTESTFKNTNCKPAKVSNLNKVGRRSYNNRGRFSKFRFKRSAVPRTPPRELCYSSDDEEYMVHPEDIPDLMERAKQADVLETFMGTGEDEKEFSTEMLIYEKETTEDRRIVSKRTDLIIPGGPKTSTYSGQEIEDSDDASDELAFHGSCRHVENLDQQSNQSSTAVIERKNSYTNNLVKSKLLEMKSANTKERIKQEDVTELHNRTPDENTCKAIERCKTRIQKEDKTELKEDLNEVEEKVNTPHKLLCESPTKASPENKARSEDTTENVTDRGDSRKKILLSDSDVCLDWTDEENALDNKEDADVFDDSSDGISETAAFQSYIVIDTVDGSDTETPEKINTEKSSKISQTKPLEKVKEHNLTVDLSEVGKYVQESLEFMVDSICADVSESAYTIVDENSYTPENTFESIGLEKTLAVKCDTPSKTTHGGTVKLMSDVSDWQSKQSSIALSSFHLNKDLRKTKKVESDLCNEGEISIEDVTSKKKDLSKSPEVENYGPQSQGAKDKLIMKGTSDGTSLLEQRCIHDEEDKANRSIKQILKKCISEVEAMVAPKVECLEKDQTQILDEGEPKFRHFCTSSESSNEIENSAFYDSETNEHSIEVVASWSPRHSPEVQQIVVSEESESNRANHTSFSGKDRSLFIDDVLVIGQKDCDIDKAEDDMIALDYQLKDGLVNQTEIFMNSLHLHSSDSEDVPELEDVLEACENTDAKLDNERNGHIIGEFDMKSEHSKDSVDNVKKEIYDINEGPCCSQDRSNIDITPENESKPFQKGKPSNGIDLQKDYLPEKKQDLSYDMNDTSYELMFDDDKVENKLNENREEITETLYETDLKTEISVGLDLSSSRSFYSVMDNVNMPTLQTDTSNDLEINMIEANNKCEDNHCSSTDFEAEVGFKQSSSGESLSIDLSLGSDDMTDTHKKTQTCLEKNQIRGIDNDMESTSSTWAYPLSEPDNELSQRSSVYPSQLDDNAMFHIKDTFDEETCEKVTISEEINESKKTDTDITKEKSNTRNAYKYQSEDVENNQNKNSESETSGQELPQNNDSTSVYNQDFYNPGVRTPMPIHPHPWLSFNRHPYGMWPSYSMWQSFQGAQTQAFSPYSGPSLLPYAHAGPQSPLSPYIWSPVPGYSPRSSYVNSSVYSPSFMNYMLNGNQQSEQQNPGAASLPPWILSSDNMTPYMQHQNPDTYFITECITNKSSEVTSLLNIPVSEIPLPKDSPPKRKLNPRKLQELCKEIVESSQKHAVNLESYSLLSTSKDLEHSDSKRSQLLTDNTKDMPVSSICTEIIKNYSVEHITNDEVLEPHNKIECVSVEEFTAPEKLLSKASKKEKLKKENGPIHNSLVKTDGASNVEEFNSTSRKKDIAVICKQKTSKSGTNEKKVFQNDSNFLSDPQMTETCDICSTVECKSVIFHSGCRLKILTNTKIDAVDSRISDEEKELHSFKNLNNTEKTKVKTTMKPKDELKGTDVGVTSSRKSGMKSKVLNSVGYLLNNLRNVKTDKIYSRVKSKHISKKICAESESATLIHCESNKKETTDFLKKEGGTNTQQNDIISEHCNDIEENLQIHKCHDSDNSFFDIKCYEHVETQNSSKYKSVCEPKIDFSEADKCTFSKENTCLEISYVLNNLVSKISLNNTENATKGTSGARLEDVIKVLHKPEKMKNTENATKDASCITQEEGIDVLHSLDIQKNSENTTKDTSFVRLEDQQHVLNNQSKMKNLENTTKDVSDVRLEDEIKVLHNLDKMKNSEKATKDTSCVALEDGIDVVHSLDILKNTENTTKDTSFVRLEDEAEVLNSLDIMKNTANATKDTSVVRLEDELQVLHSPNKMKNTENATKDISSKRPDNEEEVLCEVDVIDKNIGKILSRRNGTKSQVFYSVGYLLNNLRNVKNEEMRQVPADKDASEKICLNGESTSAVHNEGDEKETNVFHETCAVVSQQKGTICENPSDPGRTCPADKCHNLFDNKYVEIQGSNKNLAKFEAADDSIREQMTAISKTDKCLIGNEKNVGKICSSACIKSKKVLNSLGYLVNNLRNIKTNEIRPESVDDNKCSSSREIMTPNDCLMSELECFYNSIDEHLESVPSTLNAKNSDTKTNVDEPCCKSLEGKERMIETDRPLCNDTVTQRHWKEFHLHKTEEEMEKFHNIIDSNNCVMKAVETHDGDNGSESKIVLFSKNLFIDEASGASSSHYEKDLKEIKEDSTKACSAEAESSVPALYKASDIKVSSNSDSSNQKEVNSKLEETILDTQMDRFENSIIYVRDERNAGKSFSSISCDQNVEDIKCDWANLNEDVPSRVGDKTEETIGFVNIQDSGNDYTYLNAGSGIRSSEMSPKYVLCDTEDTERINKLAYTALWVNQTVPYNISKISAMSEENIDSSEMMLSSGKTPALCVSSSAFSWSSIDSRASCSSNSSFEFEKCNNHKFSCQSFRKQRRNFNATDLCSSYSEDMEFASKDNEINGSHRRRKFRKRRLSNLPRPSSSSASEDTNNNYKDKKFKLCRETVGEIRRSKCSGRRNRSQNSSTSSEELTSERSWSRGLSVRDRQTLTSEVTDFSNSLSYTSVVSLLRGTFDVMENVSKCYRPSSSPVDKNSYVRLCCLNSSKRQEFCTKFYHDCCLKKSRPRSLYKSRPLSLNSHSSYSESCSSSSSSSDTSDSGSKEGCSSNDENMSRNAPKNTKFSVALMDYDNDLATKEWFKRKLTQVADKMQSSINKANSKSVHGVHSAQVEKTDSSTNTSQCEARQFIGQCTKEDSFKMLKQPEKNNQMHKTIDKAGDVKSKKIVCLEPDVLKMLLKAGLEMFLQVLYEHCTDQWEWCLDVFNEDIVKLDLDQQEVVRTIEKQYSNLNVVTSMNNLDSYLVRKLRSSDVLEIFVLTDQPGEDENIRSLIRYSCMETFLQEHISVI